MKKSLIKIVLALLIVSFPLLGAACQNEQITLEPVTLEYWGTQDHEEALQSIIDGYHKTRPHVTINYTKFEPDVYEKRLLNALAEDRGPDIFTVPHTSLRNYTPKILPLPAELDVARVDENGVPYRKSEKSLTLKKTRNDYLDVIYNRIVLPYQEVGEDGVLQPEEDRIFGLPLSMDTMVLYYNKDIFDNAGISEPPKTWFSFLDIVKRLTKKTEANRILQSAAALGTGNNVNYFFDLVSLLMMQNGTQMVTTDGQVRFAQIPPGQDFENPPALNALQFYVDFASTFKESYTWNEKMPNSLTAFIQGRTAMYFGYADDYNVIKQKAAKLNVGITHMPQIQGNRVRNIGKFNVEVVSRKTSSPQEAWDFVGFMTRIDELTPYLEQVRKPTPLRALIVQQQKDDVLGIFADQLLTTESWYNGDNYNDAQDAFAQLLEDIHFGKYEYIQEAVNVAASRVGDNYFAPRDQL